MQCSEWALAEVQRGTESSEGARETDAARPARGEPRRTLALQLLETAAMCQPRAHTHLASHSLPANQRQPAERARHAGRNEVQLHATERGRGQTAKRASESKGMITGTACDRGGIERGQRPKHDETKGEREGRRTRDAANATELGRSRHASAALNFSSSSSDPIALAAASEGASASRGSAEVGRPAGDNDECGEGNAPIDICLISSCRRRKTRMREPSKTSVICVEAREGDSALGRQREVSDGKSRSAPCRCRRTWRRCTTSRRRPSARA